MILPVTDTRDSLAAETAMGAVTLRVADLDRMRTWYRDALLLDVLTDAADRGRVVLGRGGVPSVVLEHAPELRHAGPREAGLFHTAILFETQSALAASLASAISHGGGRFTGSADHLVSQAFYLDDPEGNGVELYWDRDRTQWSWVHGRVQMDNVLLDPRDFLREHLSEDVLRAPRAGDARVGHVHLQVGDVDVARDFYVDRVGFDVTSEWSGQALFVSAGGYHHHMAMNTWRSRGAGFRSPALGLGRVDLHLPSRDDVGALAERLRHGRLQTRDDGRTLDFDDPWGNLVRVQVAETA